MFCRYAMHTSHCDKFDRHYLVVHYMDIQNVHLYQMFFPMVLQAPNFWLVLDFAFSVCFVLIYRVELLRFIAQDFR